MYKQRIDKIKINDARGAIEDLNRSIELNPKNAAAFKARGISKLFLDDLYGAIQDFTSAIELGSRDLTYLYYTRGYARALLGNHRAAVSDFDNLLSFDPKNDEGWAHRGHSKAELKDYKSALSDLNEAIRINPKNSGAYSTRSVTK